MPPVQKLYDFQVNDAVVVLTLFLFIPVIVKRDRVERVSGESVFLAGGGQFHRYIGKELMPAKDQLLRWIRPVTAQDREVAARENLIQVLRDVNWAKMPMEVLKAAAAVLPKPPLPTVKDLQHWLDDGTVVDNGNGTVTMGVADFQRLVIDPAAKKAQKGKT